MICRIGFRFLFAESQMGRENALKKVRGVQTIRYTIVRGKCVYIKA